MYFSTYGVRKTCLDKCLKNPLSEVPSTSNMVNEPKHSWNLKDSTFTMFINVFEGNWGWKSLWVICKILGLFVNPLTSNDKYSLLNTGNLLQQFQMQLSQKQKKLPNFFLHFLNFVSIFNIFEKPMTLIADIFLNLRTPKNVVR